MNERAEKAKRLLEDPVLQESFELVRSKIFGMFETASLRDEQAVLRAKDLLHALNLVRRALEQAVSEGKLEDRILEEERRGFSYLGDLWPKRKKS